MACRAWARVAWYGDEEWAGCAEGKIRVWRWVCGGGVRVLFCCGAWGSGSLWRWHALCFDLSGSLATPTGLKTRHYMGSGCQEGACGMSVMGIAASSIFSFLNSASAQAKYQNFQKEFQQLGPDLSSGNLPAAQSDFQALQPPATASSGTRNTGDSVTTAMRQLATDLQSGNLQGAQPDYATMKQDLQQMGGGMGHHHHHHHGAGTAQDSAQSPIEQLFAQLGQALQSGNVPAAFAALSGTTGTAGAVSVSA
jgi:hypothetical protein